MEHLETLKPLSIHLTVNAQMKVFSKKKKIIFFLQIQVFVAQSYKTSYLLL